MMPYDGHIVFILSWFSLNAFHMFLISLFQPYPYAESKISQNAISPFCSQIGVFSKTRLILLRNLNFWTSASDPSRQGSTEDFRAVANTNVF